MFCRVVDNFGDAGVCWRLARQFANEFGMHVTLWIDNLASLQKLSPSIDLKQDAQQVDGVRVCHWQDDTTALTSLPGAAVVIEAFGCRIPSAFEAAMADQTKPPQWINLEYLSAESWVEGCHGLPSTQASGLRKYFFFPGFSKQTGGLLLERDLLAKHAAFQADPNARKRFFAENGLTIADDACVVSLFCYPSAPVAALFGAMAAAEKPTVCLVPEGVASQAVSAFLQQAAVAGARATHGALTLHVLPFVDQARYDRLLAACDINFVRGEDSFVRAQWAARPFVWQIYQQEEDAHLMKLDAFLARFLEGMPPETAATVNATWQAWNHPSGAKADIATQWPQFCALKGQLLRHGSDWAQFLANNGDLASNLVQHIRKIG